MLFCDFFYHDVKHASLFENSFIFPSRPFILVFMPTKGMSGMPFEKKIVAPCINNKQDVRNKHKVLMFQVYLTHHFTLNEYRTFLSKFSLHFQPGQPFAKSADLTF